MDNRELAAAIVANNKTTAELLEEISSLKKQLSATRDGSSAAMFESIARSTRDLMLRAADAALASPELEPEEIVDHILSKVAGR